MPKQRELVSLLKEGKLRCSTDNGHLGGGYNAAQGKESLRWQNKNGIVMITIAEKLGFMTVRVIDICTKTEIGRKARHLKPCSRANFQQSGFKRAIFIVQYPFGKLPGLIRRKTSFLTV